MNLDILEGLIIVHVQRRLCGTAKRSLSRCLGPMRAISNWDKIPQILA